MFIEVVMVFFSDFYVWFRQEFVREGIDCDYQLWEHSDLIMFYGIR